MSDQKDISQKERFKVPQGSGGDVWPALTKLVEGSLWATDVFYVALFAIGMNTLLLPMTIFGRPDPTLPTILFWMALFTGSSLLTMVGVWRKHRTNMERVKALKSALRDAAVDDLLHVSMFAKNRAQREYQFYVQQLSIRGHGSTRVAVAAKRLSEDPRIGFTRALEIREHLDEINWREVFVVSWPTMLLLLPMILVAAAAVFSGDRALDLLYPLIGLVIATPFLMYACSRAFPRRRTFSTANLDTKELVDLSISTQLLWLNQELKERARNGDEQAKKYVKSGLYGGYLAVRREELMRNDRVLWSQIVDEPALGAIREDESDALG